MLATRCLLALGLLALFTFPFPLPSLNAQTDDPKAIKYPVEMKPFVMTLVDENGKPVKDAKVIAAGVRCEESPGSWIGWPTQNAGNNEFKSDEAGKVELKYPLKLGAPGLWMTVNKVDFSIQHPDFVSSRVEFDPALEKAEHTLVEGCRTLFSCCDENGTVIENFGVFIAGGSSVIWKHEENEMRTSGIPDGNWQTILVSPREDGIHLFSGVLPARYAKGKDVTIRKIKMRPGMQLSGALSDNVPRPVVDGKVVAWCLPKPAGNTWEKENPSIGWWEETTIADDGSFEFPSLPRGGTVQLIAICKGWLTTGRERTFTVGQLLEIQDEDLANNNVQDVELTMEATGSVEVEVFGPDGKPLAGATVSTWPNQKLHQGGSTLVGACYRSILSIESQIAGVDNSQKFLDEVSKFYEGKTNEQGKVTLTEIPMNLPEQLFVGFDGMRMKHENEKPKDIFGQSVQVTCATTEPQKVTVRMEVIAE